MNYVSEGAASSSTLPHIKSFHVGEFSQFTLLPKNHKYKTGYKYKLSITNHTKTSFLKPYRVDIGQKLKISVGSGVYSTEY